MKILNLLKMMFRNSFSRSILLAAISLASGFLIASSLQSSSTLHWNRLFWSNPAFEDSLLVEYRKQYTAETPYDIHWPQAMADLKAMPGVTGRSVTAYLTASSSEKPANFISIGVSDVLLYKMNLPLHAGAWQRYDKDMTVVPLVLSYPCEGMFSLGEEADFLINTFGAEEEPVSIRGRVVGFLSQMGGYPLWHDMTVSEALFRNTFAWYPTQQVMLFPIEALPYQPRFLYAVQGPVFLHLDPAMYPDEAPRQALAEQVESGGYGIVTSPSTQALRVGGTRAAQATLNHGRFYAGLFLFLLVFSFVTYQTAIYRERRRDMCILHLLGFSWKMIAFCWFCQALISCILPLLIGIVLGCYVMTNGLILFLPDPLLYSLPALLVLALCLSTLLCTRQLSKVQSITLLKSSQY